MPELLLGCGNSRVKKIQPAGRVAWTGLTTLDIDPSCGPDIVHDLNNIDLPFNDNEFDEIHASCVLEHVGAQGDARFFFGQWSEFWRITKPGGYFCGIVPRYDSPWAWGDPSHRRVIPPESLIFLDQDEYDAQVGNTSMTDFRPLYKADWKCAWQDCTDHHFMFILEARK